MTRDEREYFYKRLEDLFGKWASTITKKDLGAGMLNTFAERYMQDITGQQPLPQATFREFLSEFDYPLASDVATLMVDVAANKADIAANKVDIATNKTDILMLFADVAGLLADMGLVKLDLSNKLDKTSTLLTTSTTDVIDAINEINDKFSTSGEMYKSGDFRIDIKSGELPNPIVLVSRIPAGTYNTSSLFYTTPTVISPYSTPCFMVYDGGNVLTMQDLVNSSESISNFYKFGDSFTTTKSTSVIMYPCSYEYIKDLLSIPSGEPIPESEYPSDDFTLVVNNISIAAATDIDTISAINSQINTLFQRVRELSANQ